jgi:hypothetical protein
MTSLCSVERGGLGRLVVVQALATDDDTLLAKESGDPSLGDAVVRTDLLRGLASLVASHNIGGAFGPQKAFRTGFRLVLIQ